MKHLLNRKKRLRTDSGHCLAKRSNKKGTQLSLKIQFLFLSSLYQPPHNNAEDFCSFKIASTF